MPTSASKTNANEIKEQDNTQLHSQEDIDKQQRENKQKFADIAQKTTARATQAQQSFNSATTILDAKQIDNIINSMATEIKAELENTAPLVLTIYPQSAHFSNRLTKELARQGLTLEENYIDFDTSESKLETRVEPLVDLKGRTVLIVDTALKDGRTMQATINYCKEKGAHQVYCATLIDMPEGRAEGQRVQPNFCGATCANQSLAGFGFDVDGFFRNEPCIKAPSQSGPAQPSNTRDILSTLTSQKIAQPLLKQGQPNPEALQNAKKAKETFDSLELLYSEEQLKESIQLTAEEMKKELKDQNPVVLSMQKGGSHFTTALTELLSGLPLEEGYMHLTSYKGQHGGKIQAVAEPNIDLTGRVVVISDDLIERGTTMEDAARRCLKQGAIAVYIVVMGDKPQKRSAGLEFIKPHFHCLKFESRFLAGYGLDQDEFLRNQPCVKGHPLQKQPAIQQPAQPAATNNLTKYSKYFAIGVAALSLFAYKLMSNQTAAPTGPGPEFKP